MTLEILTAPKLEPVRHGFFTRLGGASSGIFAGLNCGLGSSDQTEIVQINRSRVAGAMGVPSAALVTVNQTHSSKVLTLTAPAEDHAMADAMVTKVPGLTLAILTADCQPVLFSDETNGVIGAAHAGWKGALGGVLDETVAAMLALGAERNRITAIVGPCISQASYEVGHEFLDVFLAVDPGYARFFANGRSDRYQFDLPAFGLHRLRELGVGHAEWIGHCTYRDELRFYSYRRSVHEKEVDYGRLISCIRL